MVSASSHLPFELILLVLDNLSDEPQTIQSCALVCRAWTAHSQARVFRTIALRSLNQCNSLLARLTKSPHITPLIRDVAFNFRLDEGDDASSISATLNSLKSIRSLSFGTTSKKHVISKDLSINLINAIASTIARPSFSSLKLYKLTLGFSELQSLFGYTSNLKHLSLIGISYQCQQIHARSLALPLPLKDVDRNTLSPTVYPEELILDMKGDTVVAKWICDPDCTVKLTSLRSLGIIYHGHPEHHESEVSAILRTTAGSLERLYIRRSKAQSFCDGLPFDLTHNRNIRTVRLDLAPNKHYGPSMCPPICILSTLSDLSLSRPPIPIEEVIVDLNIIDSESFRRANHTGWKQLGQILSAERFPSLKTVRFVLNSPVRHIQLLEEIIKRVLEETEIAWCFSLEMAD